MLYLQSGLLEAVVDQLRVEVLFLQLLLQLRDASLQLPLLIAQQRAEEKKKTKWGRRQPQQTAQLQLTKNIHTQTRQKKKCGEQHEGHFSLLAILAGDLILQLVPLVLKLFLRPLG